jgi:hypothetical protein
VELRVDRVEEPPAGALDMRVDQAFVRVQPTNWTASLFGESAMRHRTDDDPDNLLSAECFRQRSQIATSPQT